MARVMTEADYAARQKLHALRAQARPTRADPPKPATTPTKYRARATGGYSSVKEANRADYLRLLQLGGKIRGLREQVPFELIPRQYDVAGKLVEREVRYFADFDYEENMGVDWWTRVTEDVKGYKKGQAYTMFILKRKLMLHVHGIRIRET